MSTTYIPAALRQLVYERANWCCEYCLMPQAAVFISHQCDHVIAEKHGGLTDFDNLACSCALCNNRKGSDIASVDPETGQIVPLFNPRLEQWQRHFQLIDGLIAPLTPVGRATVRLLQLNRTEQVAQRRLLLKAGIIRSSN